MDTDSLHACERSGTFNHVQIEVEDPLVIDIKSGENLNGFDKFIPIDLKPETLLSCFDPSVVNAILKLLPKARSTRKKKKSE
jgi:hypothetical protein